MESPQKTEPREKLDTSQHFPEQRSIKLARVGTSLIAPARINDRGVRLLLDTGASITALSSKTVKQLGLRRTGKSINLSTANGNKQAQLYQINQLSLGDQVLHDLLIVEIEFDYNPHIQGLLGTDVLSLLANGRNYLIDNEKARLVFSAN